MKLVKEFEQEIREKEIRQVERRKEKGKESEQNLEAEVFRRSELLEKYIAKILFGWDNRKFKDENLKKLKRSWSRYKEKEEQDFSWAEPQDKSTVIIHLNSNILF